MAEFVLTGDPGQEYGGVRADDVAATLRDLEPGFYSVAEIWARYAEISGKSPGGGVSTIVNKMGLIPFMLEGDRGWRINPERLARSWPRLF